MVALRDKKELEVNIRDEKVLKYIMPAMVCLKSEYYDASLILSQLLLERVIRRVFRIHARNLRVSVDDINKYLESNGRKFDDLTDKPFNKILKKSFHNLMNESNTSKEKKAFFNSLWGNFKTISKPIRNRLVHLGESESPSLTVNCTKNNFYLIEIIIGCCVNSNFSFNPIDDMRVLKFKSPNNDILKTPILKNSNTLPSKSYKNLKLNNHKYEKFKK